MKQQQITIDDVLKAFKNPPTHEGEKLVKDAFEFADKAHGDQKRASGMPYIHHPLSTAKILATIGMDARTVAAGLLHDVPEDTPETLAKISNKFGPDIAQMIEGITKLGRIKLRGTKEEHKLD